MISEEEGKSIIVDLIQREKQRLDDNKVIAFCTDEELPNLQSSFPGYKIDKLYTSKYFVHAEEMHQYYIKVRKNKLNELLQILPEYLNKIESFKDRKLIIKTNRDETISIFFVLGDKGFTVKVRSQDELSEITGYNSEEIVDKLKKYKIKSYTCEFK